MLMGRMRVGCCRQDAVAAGERERERERGAGRAAHAPCLSAVFRSLRLFNLHQMRTLEAVLQNGSAVTHRASNAEIHSSSVPVDLGSSQTRLPRNFTGEFHGGGFKICL